MAQRPLATRGPKYSRGSELLCDWRDERPAAEICSKLGINEAALYAFLAGRAAPGLKRATRIEEATDGAVPATSWVDLIVGTPSKNRSKARRAA